MTINRPEKRKDKEKMREEKRERERSLCLSITWMNNSVQACIVGRTHMQSSLPYTQSGGVSGMKLSVKVVSFSAPVPLSLWSRTPDLACTNISASIINWISWKETFP